MARKKVGELIKEARTGAGFTQEQLAKKIKGLTAQEISKAERNELTLTQAQLKEIAKITGVTQKSLLDAASGTTQTAKKTTQTAKKTSTAKKTTASTSSGSSMKVTAAEKKLVELYRAADADTKKAAVSLLKGEKSDLGDMVTSLLKNKAVKDVVSGLLK